MTTELANIKKGINNIADNIDIILPTEVEKISRSLKLNKACGYDSISSEHLKYASNNTYLVFSNALVNVQTRKAQMLSNCPYTKR